MRPVIRLKSTGVSEEHVATIFREETELAACFMLSVLLLVILIESEDRSDIFLRNTDGHLADHLALYLERLRCENLKSYSVNKNICIFSCATLGFLNGIEFIRTEMEKKQLILCAT
jgi:hypothetical protein